MNTEMGEHFLGQLFEEDGEEGLDYFAFVGTYDGEGLSIDLVEGWFCETEEVAKKLADEAFPNSLPGTIVGVIRRGDQFPTYTMYHDAEAISVLFPQLDADDPEGAAERYAE